MITKITHLDKTLDINIYENQVISSVIKNSNNFYEIEFLEFIRLNYNKQNTILDIGANIGNHSLFFSEYLDFKKIISFEPYEPNFELLGKNLNNKKCEIINCAISDSNGEKIYIIVKKVIMVDILYMFITSLIILIILF